MFGISMEMPFPKLTINFRRIGIMVLWLLVPVLITGCRQNITMNDAYITEVAKNDKAENNPNPHFQINISIPRKSLNKIASNELYVHIHIVNCHSGELKESVEALLDGQRMNRFEDLRFKLKQSSQESFTVTGIVSSRMDWAIACVTLTGGNYTLTKVRTDRVPVRWGGPT